MKRPVLWVGIALGLSSCGDGLETSSPAQSGGGGFETGDLTARILRPEGSPARSAMVWLVRSRGDTAPGVALDSVSTDSTGLATFPRARWTRPDWAALGLDVKSDSLLGIRQEAFRQGTSVEIRLSNPVPLTSTYKALSPVVFVVGSHFQPAPAHTASAKENSVYLAIPEGNWQIVQIDESGKKNSGTINTLVQGATLLDTAFSPQPASASDSLRTETGTYLRSSSFSPLQDWSSNASTAEVSDTLFGTLPPSTDPVVQMRLPLPEAKSGLSGYRLRSPLLPTVGAYGWSWYAKPIQPTDSTVRMVTLRDQAGNGCRMLAFPLSESSFLSLVPMGNAEVTLVTKDAPPSVIPLHWQVEWNSQVAWIRVGQNPAPGSTCKAPKGWDGPLTLELSAIHPASTEWGSAVVITDGTLFVP